MPARQRASIGAKHTQAHHLKGGLQPGLCTWGLPLLPASLLAPRGHGEVAVRSLWGAGLRLPSCLTCPLIPLLFSLGLSCTSHPRGDDVFLYIPDPISGFDFFRLFLRPLCSSGLSWRPGQESLTGLIPWAGYRRF